MANGAPRATFVRRVARAVVLLLVVGIYLAAQVSTGWIERLPAFVRGALFGVIAVIAVLDVAAFASPRFSAWIQARLGGR